ncbi:hypothetical protein [Mucilaginibacter ginsenosidivorans]|uniref:Uncharacterized protein n=1 Tax=Mucilaginibacter ginsenosidivorans TaxID=398053 RepID=A0A5B8URL9_9SPHI|nr:hypothetical protein [Mucilaginibacter ginsenosidivorans]QEC61713.1 hypothetical protein FRZ54_03645 [Mucilaginibacter ginsenosidivorans]
MALDKKTVEVYDGLTNVILKFLCGLVVIILITVVLILWITSKDPKDNAKYATIESVLGVFFGTLLAFFFTTKKKATNQSR